MSPVQLQVIAAIDALGERATPVGIARRLGMHKWTLTFHLRRMRAAGVLSPSGKQGEPVRVLLRPVGLADFLRPAMTADGRRMDVDAYADTLAELQERLSDHGYDFRATVSGFARRLLAELPAKRGAA